MSPGGQNEGRNRVTAPASQSETRFRLLTAALLVFAIVAGASAAGHAARMDYSVVLVFAVLVLVGENVGLRLPTAIAISPQFLLVLAAIAALGHRGAVTGAMIVAAAGAPYFPTLRRRRLTVVAFNAAVFSITAAGAASAYEGLTRVGVPLAIAFPVTAIVEVAVNVVLCLAGGASRGASVRAMWTDMRQSALSGIFFGVVGLIVGRLYVAYGAITLVVTVGAAVLAQAVFLAFVRLRQTYDRLEVLYRFTQALQASREVDDTVALILTELRRATDAGAVELTAIGDDAWRRTTSPNGTEPVTVADGTGDPPEAQLVAAGPVRLVDLADPDTPGAADLIERLGADTLVAPLRAEGRQRLLGVVALGPRADGRPFSLDDLRLVETLANHAAVSLDNGVLVDQLRFDSTHDPLTRLPNRTRFTELLAELPRPSAILLIDLDRFKEINDTLGHHHGDLLLRSVAARIADEVAHRGIVARLGGDEFGVLLPQTTSSNAAQTAVGLLGALEQPFGIGALELEITASIGVAVADEGNNDTARLMQQADVAMYSAKESHSGWELYSSERDHHTPRRLALAGELRRAIESGEMEVHYQPKADLRTGVICGVEALVRWRHPTFGVLGPDEFIPVAEGAGLIRPLTLLVLSEAIAEQRALRLAGYDIDMAVNLSVRSVLDVHLPDQIAQVLDSHGVAPSSLTLEITESSVMADPARTIGILGRLSTLGARISVDDFGTGYSSLSYLKRLPADEVKIDRSFVAGMLTTASDAAIVRSTVDLARNLGLQAVAEGVEDVTTWESLVTLGCDFAQGYYISAPLPADRLVPWLAASRASNDPQG
jgi:diguanylate cyclase (GGDEF)-like protein